MPTYKNPGIVQFSALLQPSLGGSAPFNVEEVFGTKGMVPITASIDGVPYRGSIVNMGEGQHRVQGTLSMLLTGKTR